MIGIEFTKELIIYFVNSIDNFENYFHKLKSEKLINLIIEGGKL